MEPTRREWLAHQSNRLAEAITQLRIVVSTFPDYVRGRTNLANLLLSSDDFAGAAAEYYPVCRATVLESRLR